MFCFYFNVLKVHESGFASSGKLSYSTPDLDDEDHHSMHMPDQLLCDACQILAYNVSLYLLRGIEALHDGRTESGAFWRNNFFEVKLNNFIHVVSKFFGIVFFPLKFFSTLCILCF